MSQGLDSRVQGGGHDAILSSESSLPPTTPALFLYGSFVVAMVILNVFSVTVSVTFGVVSVLLFHAAATIAFCFSRRPISEFALVLLITLGLDIGIAASGASTATGSVHLLNLSSIRVPGISVSLGMIYVGIIALAVLCDKKFRVSSLLWVLVGLICILILTFGNQLDKAIGRAMLLVMCVLGYVIAPLILNRERLGVVNWCLWLILLTYGLLSLAGFQRQYSVSEFAFSSAIVNYAFLLPFFTFRYFHARLILFYVTVLLYLAMGFLVSGKVIIGFVVAHVALFGFRLSFFAFLLLLIAFGASPLLMQELGDLLVAQGFSVAGVKIKQLDIITNLQSISPSIFYHTSGGNIVAEAQSLFRYLFVERNIFGGGPGAFLPDYYGYMGFANDDSYPIDEVNLNQRVSLHLALFNFLLWGGVPALLGVIALMRKAYTVGSEVFVLLIFCLMYATTKFDALVFGVLVYFLLQHTSGLVAKRPHRVRSKSYANSRGSDREIIVTQVQ